MIDTPNSEQETTQVIKVIENIPDITLQQVGAILEFLIDSGVIDPPTIESGFFSQDGIDNDRDTLIDLQDPDCGG